MSSHNLPYQWTGLDLASLVAGKVNHCLWVWKVQCNIHQRYSPQWCHLRAGEISNCQICDKTKSKSNCPFLPSNSLKEYHIYTMYNLGIRFHQCLSPQKENNQTYWLHLEELEFPVAEFWILVLVKELTWHESHDTSHMTRVTWHESHDTSHMTVTWQSHDSHMTVTWQSNESHMTLM